MDLGCCPLVAPCDVQGRRRLNGRTGNQGQTQNYMRGGVDEEEDYIRGAWA